MSVFKRKLLVFLSLGFALSVVFPSSLQAEDITPSPTPEQKVAAEYNILPLITNSSIFGVTRNSLIDNMVYDQGYEAHCANREWQIDKKVWGAIEKYFSQDSAVNYWNNGAVTFGGTDSYIADLTKARIPLLRGLEPSAETLKNSSFEALFGVNTNVTSNEIEGDSTVMQNSYGVAENLMSAYHQCVYKKQNIDAIEKICKYFATEDCALNKEITVKVRSEGELKPEESKIKLLDIQDQFKKIRPQLSGEERNKQVCADITSNDFESVLEGEDAPDVTQDDLIYTYSSILAAPIDIDNLYRLGFLVIVPRQNPVDSQDKFYFLQEGAPTDSTLDAPIVVAFKMPEFSTNKSLTINNIDSLQLTKMSLQSADANQKDAEDQLAKRSELADRTKLSQKEGESTINCAGMPQCADTNENMLSNVLIDLVNASNLNCKNENLTIIATDENSTDDEKNDVIADIFNQEDLNYEKAGDLYTPANKDIKTYDYALPDNNTLINRFTSNEAQNFSWQLTVDANPPSTGDKVTVNAYWVIPVGETLKDNNKALAIFWDQDTFINMVKSNQLVDMENKVGAIPKFYTFKGEKAAFTGQDSFSFNTQCTPHTEYDENGVPFTVNDCTSESFGVSLIDDKKSLLFPDFGLGWMLLQIQKAVRSTASSTYDYVNSCQRIEDLFLGRCGGASSGEKKSCTGEGFAKISGMPSYSGIPQTAKDYYNSYIASRFTQENLDAYAAAEKATGIPCEIAAGIHWTEGGANATQSLHDGGSLHGGDLTSDAISAMTLLKNIIVADGDDPNNLSYAALVKAVAQYNGLGNKNCSEWNQSLDNKSGPRPTRWRQTGKCSSSIQPESSDQPHPVAWIDSEHQDMDLIFCLDAVEFSCQESPEKVDVDALKTRVRTVMNITDPTQLDTIASKALASCFKGSAACNGADSTATYPPYVRPGSLTTAIILNAGK